MNFRMLTYFSIILAIIDYINSVELTFELPDNSKECFYQDIGKNKTAILEYQVSLFFEESKMLMTMRNNVELIVTGDNGRSI